MTLVADGGRNPWWNSLPLTLTPSFTSTAIAAAGDKLAWIGRVWWPDGASHDVQRVGFNFGSVTKAAGSAMTISLQDVDLTTGPVIRPDGTQDQTVAIANADAGFTSNVWYRSGTLSANRTCAPGDLVATVLEYSSYVSADTVSLRNMALTATGVLSNQGVFVSQIGGTWATASVTPNVILEASDGTFGTLAGTAIPGLTLNTHAFKSDSAADEYAMAFRVLYPCKIEGAWVILACAANTANFDIVLYQGTTALATVSVDANAGAFSVGTHRPIEVVFSSPVTLSAGTQYYLAVKPTQATSNVTVNSVDVSAAGHLVCWPGGTDWNYSARVDGGAWDAVTTTRRLLAGLVPFAFDDGVGAGILIPRAMNGGIDG